MRFKVLAAEYVGARIYWLEAPCDFAEFLERLLIAYLGPVFNEMDIGDLRPVPVRSEPLSYGEPKRTVTFSLTGTALDILATQADLMGVSRSEILERLIRGNDP